MVCRLTGYGQTGPLAQEAGHDINYVAITGNLWSISKLHRCRNLCWREQFQGLLPTISGHSCRRPTPPVNLLADFAGGGLTAAFGIVAALLKREKNGEFLVTLFWRTWIFRNCAFFRWIWLYYWLFDVWRALLFGVVRPALSRCRALVDPALCSILWWLSNLQASDAIHRVRLLIRIWVLLTS